MGAIYVLQSKKDNANNQSLNQFVIFPLDYLWFLNHRYE
jgi:hypothetical protein